MKTKKYKKDFFRVILPIIIGTSVEKEETSFSWTEEKEINFFGL